MIAECANDIQDDLRTRGLWQLGVPKYLGYSCEYKISTRLKRARQDAAKVNARNMASYQAQFADDDPTAANVVVPVHERSTGGEVAASRLEGPVLTSPIRPSSMQPAHTSPSIQPASILSPASMHTRKRKFFDRNATTFDRAQPEVALDRIPNTMIFTDARSWVASKLKATCGMQLGSSPLSGRCQGRLRLISEASFDGLQVTVTLQCVTQGEHLHTVSNSTPDKVNTKEKKGGGAKQNSGTPNINMLHLLAHTLAGHSQTSAYIYDTIMMGRAMTNKQWYHLQPAVWEAVILEFGKSAAQVESMILEECKAGGKWDLLLDMGWGSRGSASKHGSMPYIWYKKQLIIGHVVLSKETLRNGRVIVEGNYKGTSGGMEGRALKEVLRDLEEKKLLTHCENVIIDKDSSSTNIIQGLRKASHVRIRYDPGHAKKSFVSQLLKVHDR